jgi:glycosyltransferase involved in cell wall biosynthesis
MSSIIKLSFVLTTFNKLEYLKVTLPHLIQNKKEDEEIIITDGGSTDGTVEYLNEFFLQKKINWFISEKDHGEAHGTNKAILNAQGELIKIITDDDIFDFETIKKCKEWMLKNNHINVLATSGGNVFYKDQIVNINLHAIDDFKPNSLNKDIWFSGLSIIFRKDSIALIGLLNSSFKIVDFEYVFRIKKLHIPIAFCSSYSFLNIINPDSNSLRFKELLWKEHKKITFLYQTNFSFKMRYYFTYIKNLVVTKFINQVSKVKTTNKEVFDYKKCFEEGLIAIKNANDLSQSNFQIKKF